MLFLRRVYLLFLVPLSVLAIEPKIYDISELRQKNQMDFRLAGNQVVHVDRAKDQNHRILFEDLFPGANWSHPAKIKVYDLKGKLLQEVDVKFPPIGLSETQVISPKSKVGATPTTPVEFKLDDLNGSLKVEKPEKFYAVLISGMADKRHWNDFSFLYRVLTELYGYEQSNIFVADSVYIDSAPDLNADGKADIQFGSTRAELLRLFEHLKMVLKETDQLLLVVNDHGDTTSEESTLVLYDGVMGAKEFSTFLRALPPNRVLSIYEQCYSGGFVRPSVGKNKVSMSAATNTEYSWASLDLRFDEFLYFLISAFAKQTHDGKPIHSDVNRDGKVTAQEAFAYAVANDRREESPVLESHQNSGDANTIGMGF